MMENSQIMSLSKEEMDVLASTVETTKNSFVGMSDKEIKEHLQLCMKLSVENKINSKNAFGLHLIGILPMLAKDKSTDLQTASLSLQASSKIYCGRVDALYKETFQFHNHLQTILADGKKSIPRDNQDLEDRFDEGEDGPSEKVKTTQKKKLKSYVGTEESISIASQVDKVTANPHQNYELLKSAFAGVSVTKKLLNCLPFENDSCETKCGRASKIYKPKNPAPIVKYTLSKVEKNLWQKMADWEVVGGDGMDTSPNMNFSPRQSLLPPALNGSFLDDLGQNPPDFAPNSPIRLDIGGGIDDSLVIGDAANPQPAENDNSGLNILNERLGALDITACSFANDIAKALTRDGSINPALLPPQSTLRKVMRTAERNNLRKETNNTEKKKKEAKVREPFFRGQEIDKAVFKPGKKTVLADAAVAEWVETTELGTVFDAFSLDLDTDLESSEKLIEECRDLFDSVILAEDPFHKLKNPFISKPAWKLFRQTNPIAAQNDDSPGIFRRAKSLAPPVELVESFRNMTINDSFDAAGDADIPNDVFEVSIDNDQQIALTDFADDIPLVAPPELVKPINVRPQQKAMNFDTQKIKQSLWGILSDHLAKEGSVLFSKVVEELNIESKKKDLGADTIAWQFAFVMLLVLANEKVLFVENVGDGKDMIVTQDIAEVVSEM